MGDTSLSILFNAFPANLMQQSNTSYEFTLDANLTIQECTKITKFKNNVNKLITNINNPSVELQNLLFELDYIRVNPKLDNTYIINSTLHKLKKFGINSTQVPHNNSIKICYMPLGRLSNTMRFYINNSNHIILLSTMFKPKLIK
jgi:hypothetical protein